MSKDNDKPESEYEGAEGRSGLALLLAVPGILFVFRMVFPPEAKAPAGPFDGLGEWLLLALWAVVSVAACLVGIALAIVGLKRSPKGEFSIVAVVVQGLLGLALFVIYIKPSGEKLTYAARNGDMRYVKWALFCGVNPIHTDPRWKSSSSALSSAARGGHNDIVLLLLDRGMDPNFQADASGTPLQEAIFGNHMDTARLLIARGADPKRSSRFGGNPLHWVTHTGNIEFADYLLSLGCDINADTGYERTTPLHHAAKQGTPEMIRHLVEKGADPTKTDSNGANCIKIAERRLADIFSYRNQPPPDPHQAPRSPGPTDAEIAKLEEAISVLKHALPNSTHQ